MNAARWIWLLFFVVLFGGLALESQTPASAAPGTCEHRSAEHAAQQHETREGDSRWHVLHGQLPTCGLDDDKKGTDDHHDSHNDDDRKWDGEKKDHPGFHCYHFHCG